MAAIATPLCIGPADHGRTMTLEEFSADADVQEGYRYELREEFSKRPKFRTTRIGR